MIVKLEPIKIPSTEEFYKLVQEELPPDFNDLPLDEQLGIAHQTFCKVHFRIFGNYRLLVC